MLRENNIVFSSIHILSCAVGFVLLVIYALHKMISEQNLRNDMPIELVCFISSGLICFA